MTVFGPCAMAAREQAANLRPALLDERLLNFEEFKIKDLAGESTSHVMMTKDGFTLLAVGFQKQFCIV
jgi:hypothetical protein